MERKGDYFETFWVKYTSKHIDHGAARVGYSNEPETDGPAVE